MIDAIRERRSIRRFKPDPISEDQINQLLEAAQLAPSGSNIQPWRFILVKDQKTKAELRKASHNQRFVEEAPLVIVCCGDLLSWKKTREYTHDMIQRMGDRPSTEFEKALWKRVDRAVEAEMHERIPSTLLNVTIAIEHIILEAVELGLGSCWVRLIDEKEVKRILGLPDHLCVVTLLPIGIPDEKPERRPRLPLEDIILKR
ncbi:nitroreductase family protein [[Eubacterium] cellulosolvens]